MDDLNSVISSILGDPQKMEQLRSVAQSLGVNTGGNAPPSPNSNNMGGMNQNIPPFQMGNNNQMNPNMDNQAQTQNMGQMNNQQNNSYQNNQGYQNNQNNQNNSQQNGGGFNLGSLGSLASIAGILGGGGAQNDKNVQLLRALKPHFSEERAGRIDDAVRIMQLMAAWPALRDSGILGSLGNLFTGGGRK